MQIYHLEPYKYHQSEFNQTYNYMIHLNSINVKSLALDKNMKLI